MRQLGQKPSPGHLPIAHDTLGRDLQYFCRFLDALEVPALWRPPGASFAASAGLPMRTSVNGDIYSGDEMKDAGTRHENRRSPESDRAEQHPRAQRRHRLSRWRTLSASRAIDGTPDYLDEITEPRTSPPAAEKEKTESGQ
jgi:hypothetical protein